MPPGNAPTTAPISPRRTRRCTSVPPFAPIIIPCITASPTGSRGRGSRSETPDRGVEFFTRLGYRFNPQFTDERATQSFIDSAG